MYFKIPVMQSWMFCCHYSSL